MNRKEQASHLVSAIKALSKQNPARTLNELRVLIAMERVVARLEAHASLRNHIIFKGGFVLLKSFNSPRFTRDIDALATDLTKTKLKKLIIEALERDLDDGLWYGDIEFDDLPLQDGYGGLRINFAFQIGDPPNEERKIKKLSRLHLDLSFEEPPDTSKIEKMESFLAGMSPVSWSVYPVEYIVAEKLEAMFSRGSTNSRAKDVFDLNFLLPKVKNLKALRSAIEITFEKRPTAIPDSFADAAKEFDLRMMKSAWMSVEIDTKNEQFENHWDSFLEELRRVLK
jgi:predicted nucleotidyltransferase component of viral defense system